jgi:hypothetical protein
MGAPDNAHRHHRELEEPMSLDPVRKTLRRALLSAACALFAWQAAPAQTPSGYFMLRSTAKAPEAVVAEVKSYVLERKWLYLAEFKVRSGQVTVVKLCVTGMGDQIWAAGMHVAAFMPCGHLGVYREGGVTRLSMLDPRFMNALNPDPNLQRVGDQLYPLFARLLDEVSGQTPVAGLDTSRSASRD